MLRTMAALLALLLALPHVAAAASKRATGAFAEGERYVAPADHAPPQVSRAFLTTVSPKDGKASVEVPATGAGRLILWTIPIAALGHSGRRPLSSLAAPGGAALRTDETTGQEDRKSVV